MTVEARQVSEEAGAYAKQVALVAGMTQYSVQSVCHTAGDKLVLSWPICIAIAVQSRRQVKSVLWYSAH